MKRTATRTSRTYFVRCYSKLTIVNPATEQSKQLDIELDTEKSVAQKFQTASKAQEAWGSPSNLSQRKQIISKFQTLYLQDSNVAEGARFLTEDMGKPITQATNEIKGSKGRVEFFLNNFESAIKDDVVHSEGNKDSEIIAREPLGVVANISAWNYPYFVGLNVLLPALLTGNSVLYKPSEFTTQTGAHLVKLLHEAGVPKDVLIPIYGKGDVGQFLLKQHIDGVFFTGSVPTGKKIAQTVAANVTKVQLELGGKDPTYVASDLSDNEVDKAAEGLADGAMYNTGQSCCSVERIYVHAKVYDRFVTEFQNQVKGFKVGDPLDKSTYIGPLARQAQIEVLEDQVADAVSKGAKVVVGGKRTSVGGKGWYFEPTVVLDVNHKMKLMKEESFGPIIGIQKVNSEQEAVELMNDTEYGLTAGVFSNSQDIAKKVLSQVKAGSVYWNCCDRVSPRLPWSGRRFSGLGLTLSKEGIVAFTAPKAWHFKHPAQ